MPWLNLLFKDSTGRPLKQRPYELNFGTNDMIRDQTDEQGRLLQEVPEGIKKASLSILHRQFFLELDALPDVTEVAGVQERLNLLNFFSGRVDGDLGPVTQNALQSFQRSQALPETGECDATTLNSLKEICGT